MSENVTHLTPRQAKAITALMSTPTIEKAAEIAGVTPRTLHRWLKLPHFKAELQQAEGAAISEMTRVLLVGQSRALAVLYEMMTKARNENVRKSAAVAWCQLTRGNYDKQIFEERLAALEVKVYGKN
jgi:phage terminase small subunit